MFKIKSIRAPSGKDGTGQYENSNYLEYFKKSVVFCINNRPITYLN